MVVRAGGVGGCASTSGAYTDVVLFVGGVVNAVRRCRSGPRTATFLCGPCVSTPGRGLFPAPKKGGDMN